MVKLKFMLCVQEVTLIFTKLAIYKQIQRKMLVGSINGRSFTQNCDETSLINPLSESSLNLLQNGILAISVQQSMVQLRMVEFEGKEICHKTR